MSMEDILQTLVNSRQQGNTSQQSADPMTNLIGGLLGGQGGVNLSDGVDAGDVANLVGSLMGGTQQPTQATSQQQSAGGLGNMMGLLENVMNGQSGSTANDPIMGLLEPFVAPLAKKANISPAIAMIVVSFVAHKLLAHHPTSGRDSNSFDLDDMLQQIGSGKIDSNMLKSTGMVKELSKKTGLDEATAAKSLEAGFSIVGKTAAGMMTKNSAKPSPKPNVPAGNPAKSLGAKTSAKSAKE